jgi:hypothetical protein
MAGNADRAEPRPTSFQTVRLGVGRHDKPGAVVCVMELASMIAGERFTDRPSSVCPVLGSILRSYNDNLDDQRRSDLYRYAAEAVGTRGDFSLQLRRAELAIDWARTRYARRGLGRRGRARRAPAPDWGPDQIASYVVGSLGHRNRAGGWSEETHEHLLALIDTLIAVGLERRLGVQAVEHLGQPVQDRRSREQLIVAELGQCVPPHGLEPCPARGDELLAVSRQRGQNDPLVVV